jgi:hypothetical protein
MSRDELTNVIYCIHTGDLSTDELRQIKHVVDMKLQLYEYCEEILVPEKKKQGASE